MATERNEIINGIGDVLAQAARVIAAEAKAREIADSEAYTAYAQKTWKRGASPMSFTDWLQWRCAFCGDPIMAGQDAATIEHGGTKAYAHAGCFVKELRADHNV